MNKVILGLILAVCVLGMALVMLNERLGRKTESPQIATSQPAPATPPTLKNTSPATVYAPTVPLEESGTSTSPVAQPDAGKAMAMEKAEAAGSLAPPLDIASAKTEPVPVPTKTVVPAAPEPENRVTQRAPAPVEAKPEPAPAKAETEKPVSGKSAAEKQAKPEKSGEKAINRFVIYSRDKGATVRIGGGSRIQYTSMTLDNPDRIVVDMDGQWQFPPNPGIPKNEMVSNVRIGRNGDKTRVVIDLKGKPRSVRVVPGKNGDSIDIRVDK